MFQTVAWEIKKNHKMNTANILSRFLMPYCLLSLTKIHSFVYGFLRLAVITGCSVS